nr:MAG TPA: hypothetical protein [Caudoviricetes sp.]
MKILFQPITTSITCHHPETVYLCSFQLYTILQIFQCLAYIK